MFDQLIANYQAAQQLVNDLAILWDKPTCGVPGFGFKAARKARPQRIAASVKLAQAQYALRNYCNETKRSVKERQNRLQRVQSVIPSFTLE